MPSDVTVIIPQFNRLDFTVYCATSLRQCHDDSPQVLIVDDGSDPTLLADWTPQLRSCGELLTRPHRGVTAAWNAGLQACRTRWVVFLNNDTETRGDWCEQLITPLRRTEASLAGVRWRTERHLPQALQHHWRGPCWLQGWCFAAERSRLLDLGGFDESLELYFSDTDLQLRCLVQTAATGGRALMCVDGLSITHVGHATAHRLPDVRRRWLRDRRTFHQKWHHGFGGAAASARTG